jgi:oligogalacturonide transporter
MVKRPSAPREKDGVMTQPAARPVRLVNYLAYGANDVLGAGSMAVISAWVLIFYTKFCGLSAGQAALILPWRVFWTRLFRPPLGICRTISTGTRWAAGLGGGGFRAGRHSAPADLCADVAAGANLLVLPCFLCAVRTDLCAGSHPLRNAGRRNGQRFCHQGAPCRVRILFAQGSAILAGFLPLWLINWLGRDSANTFLIMGAIFAALFMMTAGFLYAFSWERQRPPRPSRRRIAAAAPVAQPVIDAAHPGVPAASGHVSGGYISRTFSTRPSPSS